MTRHIVVDGSNLATEGRTIPSLRQLNEAVLAYISDHPDDLVTVVVDATFGHRIAPAEVAEFDAAIANNELVSPPAGAVGRGDAFVLSIAQKVGATVISNDSYQEFHGGEYDWLFDEGRLIGGKPVPHVGWVFVTRSPVRGPVSRKAVKAKRAGNKANGRSASRPSALASQPMPVPKAPPPGRGARAAAAASPTASEPQAGAHKDGGRRDGAGAAGKSGGRDGGPAADRAKGAAPAERSASDRSSKVAPTAAKAGQAPIPARGAFINEPLPFLTFVAKHPIGSKVDATVDAYASHGAYVTLDGARGYVPLRLMASPAPRAAREVVKLGEVRSFIVATFNPARRGIDLALPAMASAVVVPPPTDDAEPVAKRAKKATTKRKAKAAPEPTTAATAKQRTPRAKLEPAEKAPDRTLEPADKAPVPKPTTKAAAPAKKAAAPVKKAAAPVKKAAAPVKKAAAPVKKTAVPVKKAAAPVKKAAEAAVKKAATPAGTTKTAGTPAKAAKPGTPAKAAKSAKSAKAATSATASKPTTAPTPAKSATRAKAKTTTPKSTSAAAGPGAPRARQGR